MLPDLSHVTSAVRLKLSPGIPDPGGPGGPNRPPPAGACAGAGDAGAAAPAAGAAAPRPSPAPPRPAPAAPPNGRTRMASGLRLNVSRWRPSESNLITLLDPWSTTQMLSCGSTRTCCAKLKP